MAARKGTNGATTLPAGPPAWSGALHLIVSVHVREGSDALAQALARVASELSAGTPITQWVDDARTVFRCQIAVRPEVLATTLAALVGRFSSAAGEAFAQIIVVASTPVQADEGAATVLVAPVPQATQQLPPVKPREAPTDREIAPRPALSRRATQANPALVVDFAVRARVPEGLRGTLVATGQAVTVQGAAGWDVVEGETIALHPTRFWRFARSSLATGEFRSVRLEVASLGGSPLTLASGPRGWELERPVLEGDPDDPADDPILDAYEALADRRFDDARQIARGVLVDHPRVLAAHDVLALAALAEGKATTAARHDRVLLAIAAEALGGRPGAILDAEAPGNAPLVAAIGRASTEVQRAWAARLVR